MTWISKRPARRLTTVLAIAMGSLSLGPAASADGMGPMTLPHLIYPDAGTFRAGEAAKCLLMFCASKAEPTTVSADTVKILEGEQE